MNTDPLPLLSVSVFWSWLGRVRRWMVWGMGAGAILLTAGFLWFVTQVVRQEPQATPLADGLVVLTGGASRISDGVELLLGGHARRMLITGVHPQTTPEEIVRQVPQARSLFRCCIDIDYEALNTIGNAVQTRDWASQNQYRRLVIVTSAYHMPRTLFEMSRLMPDVELIAYPVVTPRLRETPWWTSPEIGRLMVVEYFKYVAARGRALAGRLM